MARQRALTIALVVVLACGIALLAMVRATRPHFYRHPYDGSTDVYQTVVARSAEMSDLARQNATQALRERFSAQTTEADAEGLVLYFSQLATMPCEVASVVGYGPEHVKVVYQASAADGTPLASAVLWAHAPDGPRPLCVWRWGR
jgi:hypothetical protein